MLVRQLRGRSILLAASCLFITIFTFLNSNNVRDDVLRHPLLRRFQHRRIYKPRHVTPPIVDNFPLAARAVSARDIPPIPSYNRPPSPHVPENTPLFIGFSRNWPLLQQTVVSYITAGWPPDDIYVVENTGTMNANKLEKLTLQNPFYLDIHRLTKVFGVKVISTPTYLSFSQLQNFYLNYAIEKDWMYYYWGHMDVAAMSQEDFTNPKTGNYTSLYMRTVHDLRCTLSPDYAVDENGRKNRWGIKLYAFDRLTLMNRVALEEVGGWDPQIPYYGTDCDMYDRLEMAGFAREEAVTGMIYDISTSIPDLLVLYRRKPAPLTRNNSPSGLQWGIEDDRASSLYHNLTQRFNRMQMDKTTDIRGRNTWQSSQTGGQGEPYYRDPEGFEKALQMTIDVGREIVAEKWGHRGCNIKDSGLKTGDEWRVEHDKDYDS
jgi:hypothetical protein